MALTGDPGSSRIQIEDQLLPPAVAASWGRCMKHGLQRRDRALFGDSLSRGAERRVAEENADLIARATPEMERLYGLLGSAHWLALCMNTHGEVVQSIGNRNSAPRELQVLMRPGRLLSEAELGTTAPGCVLEDQRTIVVNRGEHYLHELKEFFCASAPILRPDGSFAGALDISGVDVDFLPLAHDMVGLAVRGIENRMVEALEGCTLLRFHCDERLLGTPFEGILAVGGHGRIVGANRSASRLLALGRTFGVGTSLDSIIENGLDGILRQGVHERETPLRLQSHLGSVVHSRVEPPSSARKVMATARAPVRGPDERFPPGCIIEDAALIGAFRKARRVLGHGLPVLIEGETGTGKELVARALHATVRPEGPFVAVNCAAIPDGLIESELFGYSPGAFTGARRGGAVGRIEEAHRGVLLLDEVGDMAPSVQARLLRVLQERAVVRLGDHRDRPVDILVISATHRRLADMVESGTFRQDLFYRLVGHTLELPPLRARSDVQTLVSRLLLSRAAELRLLPASAALEDLLTPAALSCLYAYRWPGNLRQLHNVLRALLALHEPGGPALDVRDLPAEIRGSPGSLDPAPPAALFPALLSDAKREAVHRALKEHHGNVSAAARALGVSRSTVYGILRPSRS